MLTARAWWFLFLSVVILVLGLFRPVTPLVVLGLALLLWFLVQWLLFALRISLTVRRLRVRRRVGQDREGGTTWAGNLIPVSVRLTLPSRGFRIPYLTMTDRLPFGCEYVHGVTTTDGVVSPRQGLEVSYTIRCPAAGLARFEGVHVQLADLQGFFYHATFVRAPVQLRVLPRFLQHKTRGGSSKRQNLLPPPGIHRLHRPGSGSELLDLRDYQPGDPPKTIAWKVSARRDRLMTKEFESEVPIRCVLFLDTSASVRIASTPLAPPEEADEKGPSPSIRPLDQLLDIAAGVLQANTVIRDLTGICIFDEEGTQVLRPQRSQGHRMEILRLLADTATLSPCAERVNPERLLPLAYAFAQQVYPDLLRPPINSMPFWLNWIDAFPRHSRHSFSLTHYLHLFKKPLLLFACTAGPSFGLLLSSVVLFARHLNFDERLWIFLLGSLASSFLFFLVTLFFSGALMVTAGVRRRARWRKRLAALLSARHGLAPGGLAALLEDDDAFSREMQRFLSDHRVPYALPFHDPSGRYLHAAPEKVAVLARALTTTVARGRDNELYVLLADLFELDDQIAPLLQAVRVARARHHQVIIVSPWPDGISLPQDEEEGLDRVHVSTGRSSGTGRAGKHSLKALLHRATSLRFHNAYHRLRRVFLRLGVPIVCARGEEPLPLILERLEQLRLAGGRR